MLETAAKTQILLVSLPHCCNDTGATSPPPAEKLYAVRFLRSSSEFLLKSVHKQQFTVQNGDALVSALNAVTENCAGCFKQFFNSTFIGCGVLSIQDLPL